VIFLFQKHQFFKNKDSLSRTNPSSTLLSSYRIFGCMLIALVNVFLHDALSNYLTCKYRY